MGERKETVLYLSLCYLGFVCSYLKLQANMEGFSVWMPCYNGRVRKGKDYIHSHGLVNRAGEIPALQKHVVQARGSEN
jgi:hypothetical protein